MIGRSSHSAAGVSARDRRAPALARNALGLTSMIDVVFLLLMYFMLTTDFARPEAAMATEAPRDAAADPFALPAQPITVRVRSLGDAPGESELRCDAPGFADITAPAQLAARAQASLGETLDASQIFVVRPAADTRWEHALEAFSALRRAGFAQVRLAEPSR